MVRPQLFRFNLRTMLLALTCIGIWLALEANQARTQNSVVRWVEAEGGAVSYDWEFDSRDQRSARTHPPGPAWLRKAIGDKYFQHVVAVTLHQTNVRDVAPLAKLPYLKWLHLAGNPVAEISPLANLPRLVRLGLSNTRVADLSSLTGHPGLETLYLVGTPVEDLSALATLPRLRTLDLTGAAVRDLTPLQHCRQLRAVQLSPPPYLDETAIEELRRALPECIIR